MADVKWIKIVVDIFDDEKVLLIESMPDADALITIWFKLLCLAGKNNNSGVFMLNERIPYTDEMISTIFRRNVNTVRLALKTFEQFGMIELINGVITIPNWGKHQNLDQIEVKREYQRKYMAEKRKEQKLLAEGNKVCKSNSKTNSKSNCKTNSESNVSSAELELDKKENKNIKPLAVAKFINETINELIDAYIESRKKTKYPMTEYAVNLLINKLKRCSSDDVRIKSLEDSILNNWRDIYPEKHEETSKTQVKKSNIKL